MLTGSMVDEDTITISRWLAKNSREHRIPLGGMAKAILDPPIASDAWFFPAAGRKGHFGSFVTLKKYLDRRCGVSDWRIHDLRRTFASGLASIGIQIPVIERLLNHISGSFGGIVGVYQRYNYMPEMEDAIKRWERHVQKLV